MSEYGPRPDNKFEVFESAASADIPLAGKSIDDRWMYDFTEWVIDRNNQGRLYRAAIPTRTWFVPAGQPDEEDWATKYAEHSFGDPSQSYVVEGRVMFANSIAVYGQEPLELPALFLMRAVVLDRGSSVMIEQMEDLTAVAFADMPLLLKLLPGA